MSFFSLKYQKYDILIQKIICFKKKFFFETIFIKISLIFISLKIHYSKLMFFLIVKGKPFTSIEPGTGLNNLCLVPNSGMIFMANEASKILVYYIPVREFLEIFFFFQLFKNLFQLVDGTGAQMVLILR